MTTLRPFAGSLGFLLLLATTGCGDAFPEEPPSPRRPDLVLVTWDTVRADHVGPGNGPSATPQLDALASEGVFFRDARTPVPITLPAHASILTGLFPASHGVRDNGTFRLEAAHPTLAERCADEGFSTAAFVSAKVLERGAGLERGFQVYDDRVVPHPEVEVVASRRADHTVDAALEWLRGVATDRPIFLWVHLYDPHRTWEAPEPWSARFDPYRAEIAFADDQTGRLLSGLEHLGRLQRSIVVLASDHGEGLGEHGEQTHSYFAYDATLRVPLLLWAGRDLAAGWARGAEIPGPASLVDLAPTLVELLELTPLETDGRSLLPNLTGGTPLAARALPIETVAPAYGYGTAPIFGVLTEDDQTWFDLPRRERYDLTRDPGQLENLYSSEDAQRADALFAGSPRSWPPEAAAREPDLEARAALEALGYVSGSSLPSEDRAPIDPKDRVEVANFITLNSKLLTPTRALEESGTLLARHGALPALARFRARMLDRLGRTRDAIAEMERSLLEHPGHREVADEVAARRQDYARKEELVRAIRATLEREPHHPRARRDLALTLHQLQQVEEAESLYAAILGEDGQDDATRLNLVGLLMMQGRAQEALELADEGRGARPDYDFRLDCAAGRILAWHLEQPERAVEPLRACRDGGARLTPLDLAILADASR